MTYKDSLTFLFNYPRFAKTNSLERMKRLLEGLGNPHLSLKFVHIAGTNGKGSITAMTSSMLRAQGYKTGSFISPFIEDFRERICVNGIKIPKRQFARLLTRVLPLIDLLPSAPNMFELICAVALRYFADMECDYVCLEVGLGGRFDATNIIPPPEVAIISKIALDHTGILGNTTSKIASEKCGIIKQDCSVVTCRDQDAPALEVIKSVCPSVIIPDDFKLLSADIHGSRIEYHSMTLDIPLAGAHQIQNALVALEAARLLKLSEHAIVSGMAQTQFPVRFEVFSENPLIIIDGAHNPSGVEVLCKTIDALLGENKPTVIFGCLEDKDASEMVARLEKSAKRIIAVGVDSPRAVAPEKLYHDCAATLSEAIRTAHPPIVICGSLYLAGQALGVLKSELKYLTALNGKNAKAPGENH